MQESTNTEIIIQTGDDRLPRRLMPWLIWLIATGFVLFQFQLQLCSGPMVDNLMQEFSITALGAGILSSTFYYIYVLMQVPAGMLIDRYGARRLLSISSLICTMGCIVFANSTNFFMAEIGRILMGGGSAFAFVGALFLIGRWFPLSRFPLLIGMSDMIGSYGSFIGNISLAASVAAFNWRVSMQFAAGISLLLAMLVMLFIRDNPPGAVITRSQQNFFEFKQQVLEVLSNKILWLHGIYIGILFSVIAVFSGLWGIPLIRLQEGVSNTMATMLAAVTFLGLGTACPIMGSLFAQIKHPRQVLVGCAIAAFVITSVVIYYPPESLWVYAVLMFMLGATTSVYVFNFGLVQEITRPQVRTTASGFLNTLCVGTVPILQPLIGFILHHNASETVRRGVEVYTVANYQEALLVLPLLLLLAAYIGWVIPESAIHGKR